MSMSREQAFSIVSQMRTDLEKVIFGQDQLLTEVLTTLLAGGHLLITGAPGLAKTTLVRVLAGLSGLDFGRVQFTPDLLPTDISGTDILNVDPDSGKRQFEFARGPIFTNLLLADEINRASPRTQSALLEAMQERAVTVNGKRYVLVKPFMVFATQNPYESEGTFVLPEAQLDRFLLHSVVEYPGADAEKRVYEEHAANRLIGEVDLGSQGGQIVGRTQILGLIQVAASTQVPDQVLTVINELVRSTRPTDESCPDSVKRMILFGAGTRAGIALVSAAKAHAMLRGRDVVRWEDIKRLAVPVLRHRIKVSIVAAREQWTTDRVLATLVERIANKYSGVLEG